METTEEVKEKEPLKSIGAKDILKLGYSYAGHLRKEGQLERTVLSKIVKWRQYFIVLREGCVYVFENETSTQPKTAFSLRNYKRIQRFKKDEATEYCFKLMPLKEDMKVYSFACSDERTLQSWLSEIFRALHEANNLPYSSKEEDFEVDIFKNATLNKDTGKYYYIDDSKTLTDSELEKVKRYTKLPDSGGKKLTRTTSLQIPEDRYDDIAVHKPISSSVRRKPPKPPTPEPKDDKTSTYINDSDPEYATCLKVEDLPVYEGSSEEAKRVIKDASVGTFLIRHSKGGGANVVYVLVVSTPEKEMQYRIFAKKELYGGVQFLLVEERTRLQCIQEDKTDFSQVCGDVQFLLVEERTRLQCIRVLSSTSKIVTAIPFEECRLMVAYTERAYGNRKFT